MILSEKEITNYKLVPIIGKKKNSNSYGGFYLKLFENKTNTKESIKINAICNFENYEKGLLLRLNYSNLVKGVPIKEKNILKIECLKGKEIIVPIPFSPMWFLLKLGVSIRYARYFGLYRFGEYETSEMTLIIETKNYTFHFIKNGFSYENSVEFFEKLNLKMNCQ